MSRGGLGPGLSMETVVAGPGSGCKSIEDVGPESGTGMKIRPVQSSIKEDLTCSSTELDYGSSLRPPGDFLTPSPTEPHQSHSAQIDKLHDIFRSITLVSPHMPTRCTVFISQDLKNASHVFIGTDRAEPPLMPHYSGPYHVLSHTTKTVVVRLSGKHDTVALDRVKPAYLSSVTPSSTYSELPIPSPQSATPQRTVTCLQPGDALERGAL
ncbi:uncharacterized protein LOC135398372 [Ornithodoros turicata]|uniref:uncharacterized protein LOC135398372 n=1 Tax=Ornithodoros turicata TaxID=34597 RepID=UPI003139071B